MVQNYTKDSLVRFIYRDTTIFEHFEIQDEIENNPKVKLYFDKLFSAFKGLPRVLFSPSQESIDRILTYHNNSRKAYC
jgi:hypothetical protein